MPMLSLLIQALVSSPRASFGQSGPGRPVPIGRCWLAGAAAGPRR